MIVFILDRLLVSTHADLKPGSLRGHGVAKIYNLAGDTPKVEGYPEIHRFEFDPKNATEADVKMIIDSLLADVLGGKRVLLTEPSKTLGPVITACFLHAIGYSWEDAWDGVGRMVKDIQHDKKFHADARLHARNLWGALK